MIAEKPPIKSNRYKTDSKKVLGRGSWGTVYAAEDQFTGAKVAVKILTPTELAERQMEHRNLDPVKVMQREIGFRAARHVLPRVYEIDEEGKPFIIMPICPGTLDSLLQESNPRGQRNSINLGYPNKKDGFQFLRDIITGMQEMHQVYQRTYGDWKPENVMVDEHKRLILNDLGTSSCISIGRSNSPRDNMGHLQTRAPELFKKDSHPNIESDVYGAAALCYRIHAGEYPLEHRFESFINDSPKEAEKNIKEFFESRKGYQVDNIIWKRIKKQIPKEFRDFYYNGLKFKPGSRDGGGDVMMKRLERAIIESSTEHKIKDTVRRHASGLLIPLFIFGILSVGGYLRQYNKNLPPKPNLHGPLYLPRNPNEKIESFDTEDLTNLPKIATGNIVDSREIDRNAAMITKDNTTAYLLAQYDRAVRDRGLMNMDYLNDNQFRVWAAHSVPDEKAHPGFAHHMRKVAKNIEVALNQARLPNNNIDLEDTCAIARTGLDNVNLAKRAAGSFNFQDYISAKNTEGEYIIPEKEQYFIKKWISYIHDNH